MRQNPQGVQKAEKVIVPVKKGIRMASFEKLFADLLGVARALNFEFISAQTGPFTIAAAILVERGSLGFLRPFA